MNTPVFRTVVLIVLSTTFAANAYSMDDVWGADGCATTTSHLEQRKVIRFANRILELTISPAGTKPSLGQKLAVKVRVKNLSPTPLATNTLKNFSFYLSKYPKDEVGMAKESEVYIGNFLGSRNQSPNEIKLNEVIEFKVDLADLSWNDGLHSVNIGIGIDEIPRGGYFLSLKVWFLNSETDRIDKFPCFRTPEYFTSNEFPVELLKK